MEKEIWPRIVEVYDRALSSGAAFKTPTQIDVLADPSTNISFLLRISESVKQKSTSESKFTTFIRTKSNPFLPYDEHLWVMHLSETHTLLLNKFNLLDRHVLVVTREFQHQSESLNFKDISATSLIIKSMPNGGLAFFNCGPVSGASQPHKHIQVVPLPLSDSLALPLDGLYKASVVWEPNVLQKLPFLAFGVALSGTESDNSLLESYNSLLNKARSALSSDLRSYNLIWTTNWMVLIPRNRSGSGLCNLNSLGFAGTFFLRSQQEIDFVKSTGPMQILQDVAYPNPHFRAA